MSRDSYQPDDIDVDSLKLDELDISDLKLDDEFNTDESDLIFAPEHQQQIIDKLIHLSRFGNLLTLITGQTGSGKTTLVEDFIEQLDDSQICLVKAQPLLSIDQLFQQVIESFAGESTFTGIPLTAKQYEDWAAQLSTSTNNRLLIIDDAEQLSTSVLHELCQLAAIQQAKETPHIHILLFGNYDLTVSLEQAAQGILAEDGIYIIDIPELTEQDARQWLSICLEQQDKLAISEQQFEELLEEGEGNLKQLLILAGEVELIDDYDTSADVFDDQDDKQISLVGYWFAGLTFLVLLVIGIFIFQKEITQWLGLTSEPREVTVAEPVVESEIQSEVEPVTENQASKDTPIESQNQFTEKVQEALVENKNDSPVAEIAANADSNSEQDSIHSIKEPTSKEPLNKEAETKNVSVEKLSNNTAADVKTIEQPQASVAHVEENLTDNLTVHERYLVSQPDSHYAIQIIGLTKEQSVQNFIASLPNYDLRYYRSSLNGNPWHIVVLGSYPTKESANQARRDLSAELTEFKPWLKSYQTIKQEIESQ